MTRYRRSLFKALIFDYQAIFRGIVFVSLRAFLRVFKFTPEPPRDLDLRFYYTFDAAYAVGYLSLLSIGSIGTGTTVVVLRSSIGLKFATKYTKLTPSKARIESVIPGALAVFTYTLVITLEVIALIYVKAGILVRPKRYFPLAMLLASVLTYGLSLTFGYMAALSKRMRGAIASFVLFLAFVSYFTLRVSFGKFSYISPFQVALYVMIYSFMGDEPVLGGFAMGNATEFADIKLALTAAIIRIVILYLAGRLEMKKAKGIRPEAIVMRISADRLYFSSEKQKKSVSVIEVKDLRFRYRKGDERILKGINLEVEKGEFLLIVGPSGCGKTTLINSINGIIPHVIRGEQKGFVRVLDMEVPKTPLREISKHVGTVFQNPEVQFFMLRVIDELVFGPENLNVPPEKIEERLERVTSVIPGLKEILYKETLSLSGGQKQKVAIASVLMMGAKILILDEPTTNLDPRGAKEVLEAIDVLRKEGDITIILIEHRLDEVARFADRTIVMNAGEIIREGDPREVFSDPSLFYELGIRPPQPAELIVRLKEAGIIDQNEPIPLTVDEAVEILKKYIPDGFKREINDEEYKPEGKPIIEVRDLRHVYPDGTVALRGISLNIYEGEYVGIIGQNGAGKSTLVMHLLGVLEPSYGSVKVLGKDVSKVPVEEVAKRVGVIFQNPDLMLFQNSVREEIALGPKNLRLSKEEIRARVEESIDMMRLKGLEKRHPHALSRGQRHRVAVASILAMRPHVIIADEPTTGQDYGASKRYLSLLQELNKQGRTILVVSHDMKVIAEFAKRVIVMKQGRILMDGPTRKVFDREDILAETYLEPPKITQIAKRLGLGPILTTDEFVEAMKAAVAKRRWFFGIKA